MTLSLRGKLLATSLGVVLLMAALLGGGGWLLFRRRVQQTQWTND